MSLSRSAKTAVRQAEAEGLTLLPSEGNRTGYKGVVFDTRAVTFNGSSKSKPYKAGVMRGGKNVYLGRFATAEEAALHVARASPAQVAPAAVPDLYLNVAFNSSRKTRPYQAMMWRGGKEVTLGYFATAEEAALVARAKSTAQAAPPQSPATSSRKRNAKPDMPTGAHVKQQAPPVTETGAKRKIENRFEDLLRCKRFMSAKQYAAKHAELMKEI